MSFTWHFYTGTPTINPPIRRCHRGPMADVELVMAVPFQYMAQFNVLRKRLLNCIVDSELLAVQTREVVLRSLNTLLGPIFVRLAPQKKSLQALICEKRDSPAIEADIADLSPFYISAAQGLRTYRVPQQQIDLLVEALESGNSVMRVAGKCATILLIALIEMDYQNG